MEKTLQNLPPGSRVAVVRLRSLGDCVLTTPALQIIKEFRPDLSLGVVVEGRFAPIFEGNPDVDLIMPPEFALLQRWAPALCLNLHGGTRSQALTALSGAATRAGFAHFRYSFLLNCRIPRAQEVLGVERKVHTAEHLASAAFHLGAPVRAIPRARLFANPDQAQEPYAVIHPIASHSNKTWPAANFVQVARYLKGNMGLEPVFVAGSREDLRPFRAFRILSGAPLPRIKSLMRGASLFVGNDSGPAHMAAAFGLPVTVIFGASDVEVWRPWKTVSEVLTHPQGIGFVEPDAVIEALGRLRVSA